MCFEPEAIVMIAMSVRVNLRLIFWEVTPFFWSNLLCECKYS
jgi:hypothetical protein